jgi:hypothetical protein
MTLAERRRGFVSWLLLIASFAGMASVGAAIAAEEELAKGWRNYDAGGLSFGAPPEMRPAAIDQQTPDKADAANPDWGFTLTTRADRPDQGATLTLNWSKDVVDNVGDSKVLASREIYVADRQARRIDWRSAAMGWRGFNVFIHGVAPGGEIFSASCHSPEPLWPEAERRCEQVVATLQFTMTSTPADPAKAGQVLIDEAASGAPSKGMEPGSAPKSTPPETIPAESKPATMAPPPAGASTHFSIPLPAYAAALALAVVSGLALFIVKLRASRPVNPKATTARGSGAAPSSPAASNDSPGAAPRFCTECGARLTAPGPCPGCGAANGDA